MKCIFCNFEVHEKRQQLGFTTCLPCGEKIARQRVFTVAPMHKSNYIVISNKQDLKGINNKGGSYDN